MSLIEDDIIEMYLAKVLGGVKLPFKVMSPTSAPLAMVVFSGEGWTLHFSVVNSFHRTETKIAGKMTLYGDRERFDEDIILAKLSLP